MADSPDATGATTTSKSALKREAKRLEKVAKVAAKSVNSTTSPVGAIDKKVKEKKVKEKEDVYVDDTPKGEKKGSLIVPSSHGVRR